MGGGRGRQVSLRQYVGPVPRQERPLELQVAHGVPVGPGCSCSDDHRLPPPLHRLRHLVFGSVLHGQLCSSAHHNHTAGPCRHSTGHRSDHLSIQVQ